jgi:hypothetical protein
MDNVYDDVVWTHMVKDKVQWNMVMNLQAP